MPLHLNNLLVHFSFVIILSLKGLVVFFLQKVNVTILLFFWHFKTPNQRSIATVDMLGNLNMSLAQILPTGKPTENVYLKIV